MILITNATAVEFDPPRVRQNMDILVDGTQIVAVGGTGSVMQAAGGSPQRIIDANGALVYPGIVCSHHHYYSGLARGIIATIGPTPDFVSTLQNLWWRLDRAADEPSLYASSLICSMDAIRAGTTAVIDHSASPSFIGGSLNAIRRGMERVGLRGSTCYETTDRHGTDGMLEGIAENVAFAEQIDREKAGGTWPGLVEAHIGGHAPFTIPEDGMERIADAVQKTGRGFHIHVAEDRFDVGHSHATYGEDLVARLDRHGLLTEKSLVIHGTFLAPYEIERINERDAFLVHNPTSNMNNGVGYNADLQNVRNLALGTDGIGSDMLQEIKHAFFKHRDAHGPLDPGGFLRALAAGNRILERTFGGKFGRLEPGYTADLVINEYNPPTPLVADNLAGHIAFGMDASGTRTVLVNGAIVYHDREFPFDTAPVYADARQQAQALWKRMDEINA